MANNSQNDQDNAKIGGVLMLVLIGSMLWFCSDDRPTKPTSTSTALSTPYPINLPLTPEQQAARKKVFGEADFIWDKTALPLKYKDVVIPLVNRIHQEDARCQGNLDPATVSLAEKENKPGGPVFYVTCGLFPSAVNVYFRLGDLQSGTAFVAPTYYPDQSEARIICRDYAKRNAMNPATVDFDWAVPTKQMPDGRTIVEMKFTAKNSFGVPGRLAAECTFNATEMVDGRVFKIME